MDNIENSIKAALSELKAASQSFSGDNPQSLMDKYNLVFAGENNNMIDSIEFYHVLKDYFRIDIELSHFHDLLLSVCADLSMPCQPMFLISDRHRQEPHSYRIELW